MGDVSATVRTHCPTCPPVTVVVTNSRDCRTSDSPVDDASEDDAITWVAVSSCSIALFLWVSRLPLSQRRSSDGEDDSDGLFC